MAQKKDASKSPYLHPSYRALKEYIIVIPMFRSRCLSYMVRTFYKLLSHVRNMLTASYPPPILTGFSFTCSVNTQTANHCYQYNTFSLCNQEAECFLIGQSERKNYMLLTSEMETSDDEIIDMYRGLWKIEESFKVTKSELEARPVYVWTKEHIEAHFLKPCIYWVWRVFYIHLAAKVRRIQPLYVTYEYITRSREELGKYLDQGKILLMDCQKNKNVL